MDVYHIYIYQKSIQQDLEQVFMDLYDATFFEYFGQSIIKISIELSENEDWIDCKMLHASIVSDFDTDTILIDVQSSVLAYIPEDLILRHIHQMDHQAYDISKLLVYFSRFSDIKHLIKRGLVHIIGQDYINTVLMVAKTNMNFSIAAKKMYLHRNSLNYRIEKLEQKTSVDIKTFSGLRALISVIE